MWQLLIIKLDLEILNFYSLSNYHHYSFEGRDKRFYLHVCLLLYVRMRMYMGVCTQGMHMGVCTERMHIKGVIGV